MYKKTFIQSILDSFNAKVNQIAFDRMTANGSFDPEATLWEMQNYGDETLGECINRNIFQKLFTRNAY